MKLLYDLHKVHFPGKEVNGKRSGKDEMFNSYDLEIYKLLKEN